jgi:hypothetical protein
MGGRAARTRGYGRLSWSRASCAAQSRIRPFPDSGRRLPGQAPAQTFVTGNPGYRLTLTNQARQWPPYALLRCRTSSIQTSRLSSSIV